MSDNLGDLTISVGVDLSELSDQLDQAVAKVSEAGQAMAEALQGVSVGDEVSSQLQALGQSAEQAKTPLEGLGNALKDASEHAESEFTPAVHHAGEAAHEAAEGGIGEMSEKLVQLGEALLVAEGLREFADEAIKAYGAVQNVEISLKALTGSAEEADTAIKELKDMAISDGLSFQSLATARERMAAFGMSAEESSRMLKLVADAAGATNKSFDEVSGAMLRLVEGGNASNRALMNVGIKAEQLGEIMGVTADAVKDAWKVLDEPTRGEVLQAALIKTAGVAKEQAQTITRQLESIKQAWDLLVMEDVGEKLAKAFQPVVDFIKNDLIPAVKEAVDWFGSLSEPAQEFGIALVAVGTAAGLAAAAIGAIGLAVMHHILSPRTSHTVSRVSSQIAAAGA